MHRPEARVTSGFFPQQHFDRAHDQLVKIVHLAPEARRMLAYKIDEGDVEFLEAMDRLELIAEPIEHLSEITQAPVIQVLGERPKPALLGGGVAVFLAEKHLAV